MPLPQLAARIKDVVQAIVRAVIDLHIGMAAALHQGRARGAALLVVEDSLLVRVALAVRGFLFQLRVSKSRRWLGNDSGPRWQIRERRRRGKNRTSSRCRSCRPAQMGLAETRAARPLQRVIEGFAGVRKAGWLGRCGVLWGSGFLGFLDRARGLCGLGLGWWIRRLLPGAADAARSSSPSEIRVAATANGRPERPPGPEGTPEGLPH
jgi:hypothetical protein